MYLYCNDPHNKGCHWSGDPSELVRRTDRVDDGDFSYCPYCEGEDFDEEDEGDEA